MKKLYCKKKKKKKKEKKRKEELPWYFSQNN